MLTTARILMYILVMAGVTYLIRMLPLVLFRKKIESQFVKSFLYYVPYAVLGSNDVSRHIVFNGFSMVRSCGISYGHIHVY